MSGGVLAGAAAPAKFTQGSVMRHVVVMTTTGSIGLMALFVVDLLSLLYVSWLGNTNLTAAVGYAGSMLFIVMSIAIGLMVSVGALVSRALGARDRALARRLAGSTVVHMTVFTGVVGLVAMLASATVLTWLGATGETHRAALRFLWICLPSSPLLGLGMGFTGVLRAVGDAKRSMYVTLAGGVATAVLDPILIFGAGLGIDGAALTTVLSRVVFAAVGFHGAVVVHGLVARPRLASALADVRPTLAVAGPAVLANVATPVSAGFMTFVLSAYGDAAVAANAIISRLVPVAFGTVFALSGVIGPILGQNLGARLFPRLKRAFTDGLIFAALCVALAWLVLALSQDVIVLAFAARGEAADLLRFFCRFIAGSWLFHGALFVANAAFNNLGFPLLSTAFNWGKATLGTVPFALAGASLAGAPGALAGQGIGAIAFGVAGIGAAYWAIRRLSRETGEDDGVRTG